MKNTKIKVNKKDNNKKIINFTIDLIESLYYNIWCCVMCKINDLCHCFVPIHKNGYRKE